MLEFGLRLDWLRRALGARGARSRAGHQETQLRDRGLKRCDNCYSRIPACLPRCPRCGNRIADPEFTASGSSFERRPVVREEAGRRDPARVLTDLEKQILVAAMKARNSGRVIHVLPARESDQGEVKAGDQRLYGSDAVEAVEALRKAGLVSSQNDSSFGLTEQGQRSARTLGTGSSLGAG